MKKVVLVFAAMFALTTAMAQEDCSKKCDKAKMEQKCDGKKMDCCEKKAEGCDKKMDCCEKNQEGCEKMMKDQKPCRTAMMVKELGLNEEQAAKVKELNEKYADVLEAPHHGMRPRPQMKEGKQQKVDAVTGATEQKAKVERPRKEFTPEMKQKMEERRMRDFSPEMKQKMEERRAQMKDYETALKSILTEEQFKAYQEKMGPRHKGIRREIMKK